MEIRRFYVEKENIIDDTIYLVGESYIHATRVLRFKPSYKLIVCDGSGIDYYCEVISIDKEKVTCRILEQTQNNNEHKCGLILCIGLIKSDRFDIAIQKSVELGVSEIVPFISDNTSERNYKLERVKRIVIEACKQCGRSILPKIHELTSFEEMLSKGRGLKLFAYEKEESLTLKASLDKNPIEDAITLVIGSEGGFTEKEATMSTIFGYKSISLGNRVLRAETATIAGLSYISMFLED